MPICVLAKDLGCHSPGRTTPTRGATAQATPHQQVGPQPRPQHTNRWSHSPGHTTPTGGATAQATPPQHVEPQPRPHHTNRWSHSPGHTTPTRGAELLVAAHVSMRQKSALGHAQFYYPVSMHAAYVYVFVNNRRTYYLNEHFLKRELFFHGTCHHSLTPQFYKHVFLLSCIHSCH